jgi:hypothetical protein
MNKKQNLRLSWLVMAMLLVFGCKLGGLMDKSSQTTNSSNSSNSGKEPTETKESIIKNFQGKAKELGAFTAPVKLNPKARVKGKVAIVNISSFGNYSMDGFNDGGTDYDQKELDVYGLAKDDLAIRVEELDTLVRTVCKKGKQLGQYRTTDMRTIPAYALDCEVSVIDYKAPAVVARKTFVSKELDDSIKIDSSTTERNAYRPSTEIGNYVKSLRTK